MLSVDHLGVLLPIDLNLDVLESFLNLAVTNDTIFVGTSMNSELNSHIILYLIFFDQLIPGGM